MSRSSEDLVQPWFEEAQRFYLNHKPLSEIAAEAQQAARDFQVRDLVSVEHLPGNATRYEIVLANAPRMLESMVVSLPDFGTSARISKLGYHTPSYVHEKLGLRFPDANEVAIFLTLFSTAYDELGTRELV